jgi:hypothetical protein
MTELHDTSSFLNYSIRSLISQMRSFFYRRIRINVKYTLYTYYTLRICRWMMSTWGSSNTGRNSVYNIHSYACSDQITVVTHDKNTWTDWEVATDCHSIFNSWMYRIIDCWIPIQENIGAQWKAVNSTWKILSNTVNLSLWFARLGRSICVIVGYFVMENTRFSHGASFRICVLQSCPARYTVSKASNIELENDCQNQCYQASDQHLLYRLK